MCSDRFAGWPRVAFRPGAPARLAIAPGRFVVDGAELASADELRLYLSAHCVRDAPVFPQKDVSCARVAETIRVLQYLGIHIGIAGNVQSDTSELA